MSIFAPTYVPTSRVADRERIAADVAAFLASGKQIQQLSHGDHGEPVLRSVRAATESTMRQRRILIADGVLEGSL